jgi:hypothetical protein
MTQAVRPGEVVWYITGRFYELPQSSLQPPPYIAVVPFVGSAIRIG